MLSTIGFHEHFVKINIMFFMRDAIGDVYRMYNIDLRTDPLGMQYSVGRVKDKVSPLTTYWVS